jgi:hypothetical protein
MTGEVTEPGDGQIRLFELEEERLAGLDGAEGLAGALNVSLINGFSPSDFDTFTIMTFTSSTGTFEVLNLPSLGGDLVWKIHYNPTSIVLEVLADLDGDGVRNSSDCAPSDPTVWAVPTEVSGVAFATDGVTLSWTSLATQAGPATTYDVVRGLVSELRVGGGAAETCLASGDTANQAADAAVPALGAAFHYLVRGVNVCGAGTYGAASDGAPHETEACP